MTRRLLILLALLAPLPLHAGTPREQKPKGTTVRVTIQKMKFTPATVSLRPGDTVIWINNDQHDHTVEAADRSFASGTISPGDTFSHKVTREGTINYTCSLHPRMRGSLSVK
jgi:plastocyanin